MFQKDISDWSTNRCLIENCQFNDIYLSFKRILQSQITKEIFFIYGYVCVCV